MPDYFENLPQYNKKYNDYAFTETIMNPNKEFKSHKIAVINDKYKYVAWNKIDWNFSKIEKALLMKSYLFGMKIKTHSMKIKTCLRIKCH